MVHATHPVQAVSDLLMTCRTFGNDSSQKLSMDRKPDPNAPNQRFVIK
jgi:hypothetical protein